MKGSAIATVLVGLADAWQSWSLPTWLDCVGSTWTAAEESVTVYKVLSFALPKALDGLPGGSGATPFGQHLQHQSGIF